jgi:hypothetical protein
MKFNKYQGVVLLFGLAAFMLHTTRTEQTMIDMIVLGNVLGRLFGRRP